MALEDAMKELYAGSHCTKLAATILATTKGVPVHQMISLNFE
jgi:hypothetical protein